MNFSWKFYSIATFTLFGFVNFLLGFISQKTSTIEMSSISAAIFLWLGMGFTGLASYIIKRLKGENVFSGIRKRFVLYSAISGISLALGMLMLKFGFLFDPLSKGPIVAIVSANSIIVALLSFIFLKERLNKVQLIGFSIIIIGLLTISLAKFSTASLRGISFGIATMLFFSITNYILKYLGYKKLNSVGIITILWIFAGIFGIFALTFDLTTGGNRIIAFPLFFKISAVLTGILLSLGMLTLKLALTRGPAGPIVAISGSNAVLVTILDYAVFNQIPQGLKLIGMFIIIGGIIIATLNRKF